MSFNLYSVILLVGMIQGFVSSTLLFLKKENRLSNSLYASLILAFSLANILPFLKFLGILGHHNELLFIPLSFDLGFGVLPYLYVKSKTQNNYKLKGNEYLHLLPLLIEICYYSIIFFTFNVSDKLAFKNNIHVPFINPIKNIVGVILAVFYLFLCFKQLSYFKKTSQIISNIAIYNSLRNFIILLFIFLLIWISYTAWVELFVGGRDSYVTFNLILAAFTYYLGFSGFAWSFNSSRENTQQLQSKPLFSESEIKYFKKEIEDLMITEKPYLDSELTLAKFSALLNLNTVKVSNLLNTGFHKNFNDFMNEYRVEEVKKRMQKAENTHLTILGIALECGFNSKSSFNRAFKKHTGVSPKELKAE